MLPHQELSALCRTAPVSAALLFTDPRNLVTLRQVIPGELEPHEVTGYRYATLLTRDGGSPEPFVVALRSRETGPEFRGLDDAGGGHLPAA